MLYFVWPLKCVFFSINFVIRIFEKAFLSFCGIGTVSASAFERSGRDCDIRKLFEIGGGTVELDRFSFSVFRGVKAEGSGLGKRPGEALNFELFKLEREVYFAVTKNFFVPRVRNRRLHYNWRWTRSRPNCLLRNDFEGTHA